MYERQDSEIVTSPVVEDLAKKAEVLIVLDVNCLLNLKIHFPQLCTSARHRKDLLTCQCNTGRLAWEHRTLYTALRRERVAYSVPAVKSPNEWKVKTWWYNVGRELDKASKRSTGSVLYQLNLMLFYFHPRGDILLIISLAVSVESCVCSFCQWHYFFVALDCSLKLTCTVHIPVLLCLSCKNWSDDVRDVNFSIVFMLLCFSDQPAA